MFTRADRLIVEGAITLGLHRCRFDRELLGDWFFYIFGIKVSPVSRAP